ncbi:MAG: protein kinase domain-containing protein [Thermomicrobiales bacterium]
MEKVHETLLGQYRIEALLGRGNRAAVYRAVHAQSGQLVSLRVFDRALSAEPTFTERFQQVAATLKSLQHPNLLPVQDFDQHAGRHFLVRPYIAGGSLRRRLGTPLPPTEVLQLLQPIAAALDYAHGHGIVHGDLKPGNILLPAPGQIVITDFGIAQLLPRGNSLLMAATGRYYGTPEYLSPEQAHALPLDGRSDIYSLGVMLYEALTGRPPFRAEEGADTPRAIAARHITTPPPAPRLLNPTIAPEMEQIVLRALAKDPAERFATAAELVAAFETATGGDNAPTSALPLMETAALPPDLLATTESTPSEADSADLAAQAARHAAELQAMCAAYEAHLAADAEVLRGKEAIVETLNQQVAAARQERAALAARLEELSRVAEERDTLVSWVKDFEQVRAQVLRLLSRQASTPANVPGEDTHVATSPTPAPVGQLVILDPQRSGLPKEAAFSLRSGAVVGRHPGNAIPINDEFISTRHAELRHDADGWWVTDLGTTNGTYVNGARVAAATQLHTGDEVRFGRVRARFV